MNVHGIDVSKKTLEVAITVNGEVLKGMQFE